MKTHMPSDQPRTFVWCDLDLELLKTAEPDLPPTFSSQVLNPSSEITTGVEMTAAARSFKIRGDGSFGSQKSDCAESRPGWMGRR